MKYVFCGRNGSPLYEDYRVRVDDNEERRLKFMMTMAFRCQMGSEIIDDYGFDLEGVIADARYLKIAAMEVLNKTDYFPGVGSFTNVETNVSGNVGYINFSIIPSEASGIINMGVNVNVVQ